MPALSHHAGLPGEAEPPTEDCGRGQQDCGCYGFLQVEYDNHPLYKRGETARTRSPVRIFTNIPARDFVLPEEEGYRLGARPLLPVGSPPAPRLF